MSAIKGWIAEGGRLIVPATHRRAMGLSKGDAVSTESHGDELRIRPARSALRRLQEKVIARGQADRSVADELIAERRAEAAHVIDASPLILSEPGADRVKAVSTGAMSAQLDVPAVTTDKAWKPLGEALGIRVALAR